MDGIVSNSQEEIKQDAIRPPEKPDLQLRVVSRQKKSSLRIPLPSLGLRFSERKLLLVVIDLFILNTTLWITLISRGTLQPEWEAIWNKIHWFLLLNALWIIIGSYLEVYNLRRAATPERFIWGVVTAALATTVVYLLIPYISPSLPQKRSMVLLFPSLLLTGLLTWRTIYAKVFAQPVFRRRAIIVGAGSSGRAVARLITTISKGDLVTNSATGYQLLGFADHRDRLRGANIGGFPVLAIGHELVDLVKQLQPNEIILAYRPTDSISDELFESIVDCGEMGVPLVTAASLYEEVTGRVPLQHVGRNLSMVFPLEETTSLRLYILFRRLFDIVVSGIGCMLFLLLIPLVWLGHRFSPGPLLYRQRRVGKSGKIFHIIKFRSMIDDAEKLTGAVWASKADSRVTTLGRFLRRSRLDELPQFWNILKGEMSLIGPRPERPEFVERLSKEIPYYRIRHAVRPGITGWAQVRYPYGASVEDSVRKLQYDLYYIKHQGPYIDSLILLHTLRVIARFKGI
jgi:exopolysaccharide biosynthesis polyprenyl glycosylphosphotransferase